MHDHEAIARLKQGDIAGLAPLVHHYQYQAVRAAILVVRDRSAAEDIVQSAFLRVVQRIQQFDSQRAFGPWFMKIVLNDALKDAQRRERHPSLDQSNAAGLAMFEELMSNEPQPEALLEQDAMRETVVQALNQLTPLQRAAIVQRYYLGMSEAEMAHDAATSPGAIKQRLLGARERLRRLLAPIINESV
ncbi:RNA polymerase sigma factor [Herpetosiphon sp. NSE202]|uniref:RNA polymerase sigma factor n=1 Tax=Herpetosiphon sp. NSE202 TaxID=3351349 RepID=UPI00362BF8B6